MYRHIYSLDSVYLARLICITICSSVGLDLRLQYSLRSLFLLDFFVRDLFYLQLGFYIRIALYILIKIVTS